VRNQHASQTLGWSTCAHLRKILKKTFVFKITQRSHVTIGRKENKKREKNQGGRLESGSPFAVCLTNSFVRSPFFFARLIASRECISGIMRMYIRTSYAAVLRVSHAHEDEPERNVCESRWSSEATL